MDCGKNGLAAANDTALICQNSHIVGAARKCIRRPNIGRQLNAAVDVEARSLLPEGLAQICTGSAVDAHEGALSDSARHAQCRGGALLAQAR